MKPSFMNMDSFSASVLHNQTNDFMHSFMHQRKDKEKTNQYNNNGSLTLEKANKTVRSTTLGFILVDS